MWERPGLSKRDRSLITVASLIALYRTDQLRGHIRRALDNGVTKEEIGEVITHMAFYSGWPTAANAVQVAKQVLTVCKGGWTMEKTTILVGTIGQGVMRSHDGGRAGSASGFTRACIRMPWCACWRTTRGGQKSSTRTDKGLYCSDDTGASWKQMDSPLNPYAVWAITVDPSTQRFCLPGPARPVPPRSSARQMVAKLGGEAGRHR